MSCNHIMHMPIKQNLISCILWLCNRCKLTAKLSVLCFARSAGLTGGHQPQIAPTRLKFLLLRYMPPENILCGLMASFVLRLSSWKSVCLLMSVHATTHVHHSQATVTLVLCVNKSALLTQASPCGYCIWNAARRPQDCALSLLTYQLGIWHACSPCTT